MARLNLTHLATLREFVRAGTMARAAQNLGYTHGAVSQHLAELERVLGTPIVTRVGRRAVLTDAGRALAAEADLLLAAEERARSAVSVAGGAVAGRMVLGTWGSAASALLGPLLALCAERFPELSMTSREVPVDDSARSVSRGDVDLAFGLDYPDEPMTRDAATSIIQVLTERFWVALPPTTTRPSRPSRPSADLADLAGEPWILPDPSTIMGRVALRAFRRAGAEPSVKHEVNDTATTLQLVGQGLGISLATDLQLSLFGARPAPVRRLDLVEEITRDLVILAPADITRRRSLQAVIDATHDVVAAP